MFLRLSTQWIIGGMGVFVGLNYQSVEFLFNIYEVEDRKQMLEDLRALESGALRVLRAQGAE